MLFYQLLQKCDQEDFIEPLARIKLLAACCILNYLWTGEWYGRKERLSFDMTVTLLVEEGVFKNMGLDAG